LNDSGGFSVAHPQLNLSFNLTQGETLRAIGAQPKILNCFVFCVKVFCVEAKKSASIQTHQRLGALRIGTLRDHESVAAASYLDVNLPRNVARHRKLLLAICPFDALVAVSRAPLFRSGIKVFRQLQPSMSKAHVC
jgi:hypothetical protein